MVAVAAALGMAGLTTRKHPLLVTAFEGGMPLIGVALGALLARAISSSIVQHSAVSDRLGESNQHTDTPVPNEERQSSHRQWAALPLPDAIAAAEGGVGDSCARGEQEERPLGLGRVPLPRGSSHDLGVDATVVGGYCRTWDVLCQPPARLRIIGWRKR
jgi:hypothetical protein